MSENQEEWSTIEIDGEEKQKAVEFEVEGEEVLKPENRINPMNTEHMMDIFYLAARQHKEKSITPEHKKMLDEKNRKKVDKKKKNPLQTIADKLYGGSGK